MHLPCSTHWKQVSRSVCEWHLMSEYLRKKLKLDNQDMSTRSPKKNLQHNRKRKKDFYTVVPLYYNLAGKFWTDVVTLVVGIPDFRPWVYHTVSISYSDCGIHLQQWKRWQAFRYEVYYYNILPKRRVYMIGPNPF